MTRSSDLDPFDQTIGQRIFRSAKRVCIVFAVGAVALSALDLMNIRSVANAAEFIHRTRQRIADLSDLMRSGIQSVAEASPSPYAVAMIPRGEIAVMPPATRSTVAAASLTSDASPVSECTAARDLDAVEAAMEPPPAFADSEPPIAVAPAPMPASADADPLPVSLPMSTAIPLDTVPMPRPAPGVPPPPPPSPAERLHLEGAARAKAERCLADAIYFEARGESERGQEAVAQVVMNRVFTRFYPHDVCGVVYQNANRHRACQFSFACSGKRMQIDERDAWALANRIAKQTLDGKLYVPAVGTSTHYHAVYVHPNWVREMRKIAHYGIHDFYRPIAWGNGADEPVWSTAALAQDK